MPPQTIPFSTGNPNVSTFPFKKVTIELKDGSDLLIEGEDLEVALQYAPSSGIPKLVHHLKYLQERLHGVQNWSCTSILPTCGAAEGMAYAFDTLLTEGDTVIVPIPVYLSTADAFRLLNLQYIKVPQDKDGPNPKDLHKELLKRYQNNKPLPKIMYINPTGCNPTGTNIQIDRRKKLYKLACDYNFLIVEDDPYYFLNYSEETIPSFLSMDVEGRVLRLDSFSKVLSPGLRVGYVTGPTELIRTMELQLQATTMHVSSMSQVIVYKVLDVWGYDKFFKHTLEVKKFYRERRNKMVAACEKHLNGICEWDSPDGGMFIWLKVPCLKDTLQLAMKDCLEHNLLIVPGHPFAGDSAPPNYNFIRLSFSSASSSQIEQGTKLLAKIIQDVRNK